MRDIHINTLLYLVLAAMTIGATTAYFLQSINRATETQVEQLRPQVTEGLPASPSLRPTAPATPLPQPETNDQGDGEIFCAQVITQARDPNTGEVAEFPTPCDVPKGWEIQNSIVN